jgi:hypothetical protein
MEHIDRQNGSESSRDLISQLCVKLLAIDGHVESFPAPPSAIARNILWLFDCVYECVASRHPHMFGYDSEVQRQDIAEQCNQVLASLISATVPPPTYKDRPPSTSRVNEAKRQKESLRIQRLRLKVDPLVRELTQGCANVLMRFMVGVWRYVDEKCRENPDRYHSSLITIAMASIFEFHCARDTTMTEYAALKSIDSPKREFFYNEVFAAVDNNFERWACAISAPYANIPPGGMRTSMTRSELNIISPFDIILECLILVYVYSFSVC